MKHRFDQPKRVILDFGQKMIKHSLDLFGKKRNNTLFEKKNEAINPMLTLQSLASHDIWFTGLTNYIVSVTVFVFT